MAWNVAEREGADEPDQLFYHSTFPRFTHWAWQGAPKGHGSWESGDPTDSYKRSVGACRVGARSAAGSNQCRSEEE